MDVARSLSPISNAEDDVNVKNSYPTCWERAPERPLLEVPSVPPLATSEERR
ncbi:Hypothetical protein A7982_07512 [Minicystis rosea]|nr:Hypothetical protein A7982_07512 [Minicystis rosea]